MQLRELICSDLYRYHGKLSFRIFLKTYLFTPGFNYMVWFRVANSNIFLLSAWARILLRVKQRRSGIQIPVNTQIGPGFYIGHGGPCVVNSTARIGANVNISQFVTIGSNHNQAAWIGDNVYIGPNVVIIEDMKIENNVTIGAGAIVTRPIPENATVAGNPAKVLNTENPGRYVNRRWPPSKA